jgi:hypothetical protein
MLSNSKIHMMCRSHCMWDKRKWYKQYADFSIKNADASTHLDGIYMIK